ncbi:hypothetical protein [Bradyrhizobium liaoningense]|uniref:hypothetical protein n=1 Tax=Bradyrhizobium liaoningense TaxID=43992 RepID=UPI0012FD569C|nr:hypothetical protein [Bradyrhizobium liaoningense]
MATGKSIVIGILVVCATFTATIVTLDFFFGEARSPWVAFAPSVGSLGGSIGSTSAVGSYKLIGTTVHFQLTIDVVTNGTATGALTATLPYPSRSNAVAIGRDVSIGNLLQGVIYAGTRQAVIFTYNNAYPGGDRKQFYLSGTYEARLSSE